MRNVLALVGAATVTFLALGWYLGWYQISSLPSPGGKQSLQVEINSGKITEDVKKGVEKGGEIVDHLRDKAKSDPNSPANSGPASNFFTPSTGTGSGSSGGWKPSDEPRPSDSGGVFGLRVPRN
jgi:hypothetical protein